MKRSTRPQPFDLEEDRREELLALTELALANHARRTYDAYRIEIAEDGPPVERPRLHLVRRAA